MWRPQLGMIGYYWPVPSDWPWGENDPRYPKEKQLVDYLAADIASLVKRSGIHHLSSDAESINFVQGN